MPLYIKRFFVLSLILFLLILLPSCGASVYRDDLTSAAVMDEILDELDAENQYRTVGDSFISTSSFGEGYADFLALLTDHRIVVATDADNNINEIGVFRVKNAADVAAAEEVVKAYVTAQQTRLPDYLALYNPDEISKVENATVKTRGNYILYTFLNNADTLKAKDAFRNAVTKD